MEEEKNTAAAVDWEEVPNPKHRKRSRKKEPAANAPRPPRRLSLRLTRPRMPNLTRYPIPPSSPNPPNRRRPPLPRRP